MHTLHSFGALKIAIGAVLLAGISLSMVGAFGLSHNGLTDAPKTLYYASEALQPYADTLKAPSILRQRSYPANYVPHLQESGPSSERFNGVLRRKSANLRKTSYRAHVYVPVRTQLASIKSSQTNYQRSREPLYILRASIRPSSLSRPQNHSSTRYMGPLGSLFLLDEQSCGELCGVLPDLQRNKGKSDVPISRGGESSYLCETCAERIHLRKPFATAQSVGVTSSVSEFINNIAPSYAGIVRGSAAPSFANPTRQASPTAPPAPAPATYKPTELQALKLQVLQKDAQLAQVQLQRAQQAFQGALAALDAEAGAVKKANNWPAEVQFSPDTLTFEVPKLPPGQPEAKKP